MAVLALERSVLWQSELLALIHIDPAWQTHHERGCSAALSQANSFIRLVRVWADAVALRWQIAANIAQARDVANGVVVREHPGARRTYRAKRLERLLDRGNLALFGPGGKHVAKVEGLVVLVWANPAGHALDRRNPRLGTHHAVVILVENLAPAAIDLVHSGLTPVWVGNLELGDGHVALGLYSAHLGRELLGVWQAIALDHAVRNVDSEAGGTSVEPEAQHGVELVANRWVLPVKVGLRRVKDVQVPLAELAVCFTDAGPGAATEYRWPVVRGLTTAPSLAVSKDVHVALRRTGGCLERLLK